MTPRCARENGPLIACKDATSDKCGAAELRETIALKRSDALNETKCGSTILAHYHGPEPSAAESAALIEHE